MTHSVSAGPTIEHLRSQLFETFGAATFPMRRPVDILPVMAEGRNVFVVGDVELVALELALTVGESLSFPYEAADDLVDDVVAALGQSTVG